MASDHRRVSPPGSLPVLETPASSLAQLVSRSSEHGLLSLSLLPEQVVASLPTTLGAVHARLGILLDPLGARMGFEAR